MMKDALGQTISRFDQVLYADVADGSVHFERATIIRFTPKMIEIDYTQTKYKHMAPREVRFLTSPSRIVLYPGPIE